MRLEGGLTCAHLGHSSLEGGAQPMRGQAPGSAQGAAREGERLEAGRSGWGWGHFPEKSTDGAQPACWEKRKLPQGEGRGLQLPGRGPRGFGRTGPAPSVHHPGQQGRLGSSWQGWMAGWPPGRAGRMATEPRGRQETRRLSLWLFSAPLEAAVLRAQYLGTERIFWKHTGLQV